MSDFLAMGGYAAYVWTAYGIVFVLLLVNALEPVYRHRHLLRTLARLHRRHPDSAPPGQARHRVTLRGR